MWSFFSPPLAVEKCDHNECAADHAAHIPDGCPLGKVKSNHIASPLLHNLEQCRGAGGHGVQFAGGVALYQYARNTVNAGAVCDGLKPAFLDTDCVNLCKTLFGQVLCCVGGNIAADIFQCGFHGFCPPVLVQWGCSPYLSGLIILYPYICGLSMLSSKYIHINMDKNKRPKLYTLPDTLRWQSSPAADTIVCLVSGVDRCSASSVRACVSVRGLLCAVFLASGTACVASCAV
nr:MAG TPA: hypothetical protein [Caudoviricetes sp.]